MHMKILLIAVAASLAAAPATAQNNMTEPDASVTNEVTTNDMNLGLDANLVATTPMPDNAFDPAPTEVANTTPADDDDDRGGIPWGLLGLAGLIGLLGRRRG